MSEFDTRDRWIMLGLVVLGLFTVVAAVLSGRSTINYALEVEAGNAAQVWSAETDKTLRRVLSAAAEGSVSGGIHLLEPTILQKQFGDAAAHTPDDAKASSGDNRKVLANRPNWLTEGLAATIPGGAGDEHVSRMGGFAVLDPSGQLLATGRGFTPDTVSRILSPQSAKSAFAEAVTRQHVTVAALPGEGRKSLAFVPVTRDGKVARVYAFDVDQSAAAWLTNLALAVVTVTTCLLIIMGFTVPAAIASRRIRERWQAEDKIRYLAMHDSLTGLPNRLQFHRHLEHALVRARRHDTTMAVFGLDLDRFKHVNDTLGHATGDALLEEVAARLKENVRDSDVVGRMGGDEFAVVAENIAAPEDAMRLARRICTALSAPYNVNGHEVTTSASVGIALGPLCGQPSDVLMKHADLALYRAKQDGRSTFRFFEPAMDAALQKRRRLETDLRNAIRKNQLYLDYQPQFGLSDGGLSGYEALVRWWHPTEGEILPSTFLPIAEETGLIVPLSEWVLTTACTYALSWAPEIRLAVNLSSAQFKTQDVFSLVRRVLAETGLEPQRLELEITEGTILQNTESVIETLTKLDQLGVSIAMDDFGTGYSSLSYLTRFPVKKIKIDRSFIDTLGTNPQTSAIVSSIVGLGQSLHVTITAEGVETEGQAALLKRWGCDQVQGYYQGYSYGRPEAEAAMNSEEEKALDTALVA
ncbi:EAL domain-containing protein [Methyloceanibacter sp.]|uniref:putative bifunctional diguanylate cyclase/phosphodiesterase n=1 Tax=Methyloceanibacter sp. TaxID=1965321 RepID=UPI002BDFA12E|nr:EAL domain-containing protein [Methyloceanibacter sp.]HML91624.1 EAL domain-containing protein [Methyloceanibacter sp.]